MGLRKRILRQVVCEKLARGVAIGKTRRNCVVINPVTGALTILFFSYNVYTNGRGVAQPGKRTRLGCEWSAVQIIAPTKPDIFLSIGG